MTMREMVTVKRMMVTKEDGDDEGPGGDEVKL